MREEEGVALVFALLATLIMASLATIALQRALTETRATGHERAFESAVHHAEASTDEVISHINTNDEYMTLDTGGAEYEYTLSDTATEAEQRAWAIAQAQNCVLFTFDGGEGCGIRPYADTVTVNGGYDVGEELRVLYGVGFVPSRDAADRRVRVIKIQFDRGFFGLNDAIRTGGCIEFQNAGLSVLGLNGNVHTNACLNINADTQVQGQVTYSGTSGHGGLTYKDTSGNPQTAQEVDEKPLPEVDALETYEEHAADNYANWYDLCPSGLVRKPDITNVPPQPCTGTLVPTGGAAWRGWELQGGLWKLNNNVNNAQGAGIFYVHHQNASISGSPGSTGDPVQLTVIVSAVTKCADPGGGSSGNFLVSGSPRIRPFLSAAGGTGILALAERDLDLRGTPGTFIEGFIGGHEQVELGGNTQIFGSVSTEDACDTPTSPIHANRVYGSAAIVSNADSALGAAAVIRVTAWNEL